MDHLNNGPIQSEGYKQTSETSTKHVKFNESSLLSY